MKMAKKTEQGVTVLAIGGRLDATSAPEFEKAVL